MSEWFRCASALWRALASFSRRRNESARLSSSLGTQPISGQTLYVIAQSRLLGEKGGHKLAAAAQGSLGEIVFSAACDMHGCLVMQLML